MRINETFSICNNFYIWIVLAPNWLAFCMCVKWTIFDWRLLALCTNKNKSRDLFHRNWKFLYIFWSRSSVPYFHYLFLRPASFLSYKLSPSFSILFHHRITWANSIDVCVFSRSATFFRIGYVQWSKNCCEWNISQRSKRINSNKKNYNIDKQQQLAAFKKTNEKYYWKFQRNKLHRE